MILEKEIETRPGAKADRYEKPLRRCKAQPAAGLGTCPPETNNRKADAYPIECNEEVAQPVHPGNRLAGEFAATCIERAADGQVNLRKRHQRY